ncbi:carboxypeptidase-like regulatory domain-containing protein [Tamlana sp. s12]|uniref:alpha-2-macroglobulin family protein n=1 Tax=Tamlana sp. s12 TaxID=1630406 RepID=UPI000801C77C|nr:MG2 domain-containing protein [Tamlana sp. s12]OBQ56033.1 alpha-2-macroglobulin [Tamlana sp. s12]QQY83458.1 carboxypeptidase-like regulatory domain-containing protein [Tamlana sp. s12]
MRHTLLLIITLLFSTLSNAQNHYTDLWAKVEAFEVQGLPQSALKTLRSIEKKAKRSDNHEQIVKVLLYKSKFNLILEEDAQVKIIEEFKSEITKNESPTKNILENILAHLYWQYYTQHKHQIYKRSKTSEKVNQEDFRTWDLQTLFNEIHIHYQNALRNEDVLKQESLNYYHVLIVKKNNSSTYRPTLFDFLSHNALEFYKTDETQITKPSYKFELNDPAYLADAKTFSEIKITSKDSTSLQYNALKIYQSLIKFHLKQNNFQALSDVDIERINFVSEHATFKNKEALELKALKNASNAITDQESTGLYRFEIASIYFEQSKLYEPQIGENNRWKAKEALDICNSIISAFPKSRAAQKCVVLKSQIENLQLEVLSEKIIPIQKPSRLLVTYKNLDSLEFKVYKFTKEQSKTFNDLYRKDQKVTFLKDFKPNETWISKLRNEKDFQSHSTEVIVPKLHSGNYLMVATVKKDEDTFAFEHIQVTDLAVLETESQAYKTIQIINRNHGAPIVNAQVEASYYPNNSKTLETKTYKTDHLGEFRIKKGDNWQRNIKLKVTKDQDTAYFGDYYLNKLYTQKDQENTTYRSFIFTDRSIYRPGQTVYFKAIAMQVNRGKSQVLENTPIRATLYNVNREEVGKLILTTNDFGSISGEFILPNNGLTGSYSIRIDEKDSKLPLASTTFFSVEAYKRPKFETTFEPITETFRVNDSITVKGQALAFSGSQISDAKVVYRVQRKVEYPRFYFYQPIQNSYSSQEITHGETTTDASGQFNIVFKAIPDQSTDPKSLPIFNYEVTADVTDINGETHSQTTTVKVGYHALTATIQLATELDKTKTDHHIDIVTENLNGSFVPTTGRIKIYKLQAPSYVLRKRPWPAPDYQDIPEKTFRDLFPFESYNNENDSNHWKKGTLVLEKQFDTKDATSLELGQINHWESGQYLITLETKDKFGQVVTDEVKTTLYSDTDKTLADNQLFSITTNKNTYNVNDTALITIGSSADNVSVKLSIEKGKQIVKTEIIKLNNNKKTISIPVTKEDVGGFAVHYSFAVFNSFVSGITAISVPYPSTSLDIQTITFRDKIQPGTDETWQFKIKGPQGEKVSTELLVSMYDASLDVFKPHTWNFKPISEPIYYSRNFTRAYNSFGTQNFKVYNPEHLTKYPVQEYDEFNWYGFNMNDDKAHKRYLNQIRSKHESKYSSSVKKGHVAGTVYDETGAPIPAVNVIIKGTTRGTMTNFDGNYSLEAKKGDILEISYIGFDTQDIEIKDKNFFHTYLTSNNAHLDDVVVLGYAAAPPAVTEIKSTSKITSLDDEADVSNVTNAVVSIRGHSSFSTSNKPLYVVDGKIVKDISNLSPEDIISVNVIKANEATAIYGSQASNGVVVVKTKQGLKNIQQVDVRKNLNETAFFFPQLKTDKSGNLSFSFSTPEALTQWKLQLLAHTKSMESATKTLTTVTQKELMVTPNAPRFLREGDQITISSKISNLTDKSITGEAILKLSDALTGTDINVNLGNAINSKAFTTKAHGNTEVSWSLNIPKNIQAIVYKVIAKSATFSDGEQNTLPVLSNRILVTETLPMWIKSADTKTFSLDKLKNHSANSSTLKNHKLTLEVTSNPAWYAIQVLPYLMEYPYQCNEQTFSRYYANTLGHFMVQANPKIKAVFEQWKNQDVLISNLEKNEDLKSILIQETPWLRDAQSETEQKKRIALLFDLNKMVSESQSDLQKLSKNQLESGAWAWFEGGRENRFITQHIISGFGHLKHLNVTSEDPTEMLEKALVYLDSEFVKTYENLKLQNPKVNLEDDHLNPIQLHYLYLRSFFPEIKASDKVGATKAYYLSQIEKHWLSQPLYAKGLMALISYRNNQEKTAHKIIASLEENSITSEEMGMYWKENKSSWQWSQAPIETQALLIEAFSEITNDTKTIDNLKIWLLKNKQTNQWKTTKATTDAVYALLLQGSDWLSVTDMVDVKIGNKTINPTKLEDVKVEAGTGYFKTSWQASEITPDMGQVTLSKKGEDIAWAGLYWQYFEDLDHITSAETSLQLNKKLFLKKNTDFGEEITEITTNTKLHVGDLVRVRIELKSDRNLEFLHMKDMRASGLEPVNVISKYKRQDGLGYYESTQDASTNFFMDYLPKGAYVFEYDLRVNNAGSMSNGITTIQSMYAPEFSSHSDGLRIKIE